MKQVKVGVIGVGRMGQNHCRIYSSLRKVDFVGVYDAIPEVGQGIADRYEVQAFSSLDELLERVDAVSIATPTQPHFDIAMQCLARGIHVLVEKPMTETLEQAHLLANTAASSPLIVMVGHIERFNPAVLAMSDVPLKPVFIESHRLASFNPRGTDVAVILDLMIHDLDLILSLVKSNPVQIDASGVGVISNTIDIANARIQFESGCVANVTASRISAKKMRKMRIFQQNSYISIDFVEGFSEIYYIDDSKSTSFQDGTLAFSLGQIDAGNIRKDIKYNKLQRADVNPLKYELNGFIDSLQNDLPVLVSGDEGLAALRLANQVLEKIAEHTKRVTLEKKD